MTILILIHTFSKLLYVYRDCYLLETYVLINVIGCAIFVFNYYFFFFRTASYEVTFVVRYEVIPERC